MNENGKAFVFLAYIGWGSAVVLIWLLVLDVVRPAPGMAVAAFLFFVTVGLFSSGLAYGGKKRDGFVMRPLKKDGSPDTYRENHDTSA